KERNIQVLNRSLQKNKVHENLKPNEPVSQHEDALLDNKHEVLEIFTDRVFEMAADQVLDVATDDGPHAPAYSCKRSKQNTEVQ
ncbi:hypothetical protein PV328_012101, partial [Microctonus aethiopoides]